MDPLRRRKVLRLDHTAVGRHTRFLHSLGGEGIEAAVAGAYEVDPLLP